MRMGRCPGTNKRARPTGFAPRIERQLLFPGRFGLFPRALGRFGHETFLDGGCRNTDVTHLAVYDRLDALQVGHEAPRSEEHTSELQSLAYLVCRLLLEKKKPPAISSGLVVVIVIHFPSSSRLRRLRRRRPRSSSSVRPSLPALPPARCRRGARCCPGSG